MSLLKKAQRVLLWLLFSVVVCGLVLLTGIALLSATNSGNRLLFSQLQAHVEGFTLDGVEGNLISGLGLDGLALHLDGIAVEVEHTELVIDWNCLIDKQVCLNRLHVANAAVQLPGVEVELSSLTSAMTATQETLLLAPSVIDGLNIVLSPTESTQEVEPSATPVVLPEINLPLTFDITELAINNSSLELNGERQQLDKLLLKGTMQQSQLQIKQLAAWHQLGEVNIDGSLDLAGDYPLDLALSVLTNEVGPLNGQQLDAKLTGDLSNLTFNLEARPDPVKLDQASAVKAKVQGELKPLDADLPFSVVINSHELVWPLIGSAQYRLSESKVEAQGSLQGYQFNVKTEIEGQQVPTTAVELNGTGDLQKLDQFDLQLMALGGTASLSGRLGWLPAMTWQADLQLADIDPSEFIPELSGIFHGNLSSQGELSGDDWKVDVDKLDLQGELQGQPLLLQGQLSSNSEQWLASDHLQFISGDNHIELQGALSEQWDLHATVFANNLQQLLPQAKGSVTGNLVLSGTRTTPKINAELSLQTLEWNKMLTLEHGELNGDVTLNEQWLPNGQLHLAVSQLAMPGLELKKADISLDGSMNDHQLTVAFEGAPVGGALSLEGSFAEHIWHGQLQPSQFDTPVGVWRLDENVDLEVDLNKQLTTVSPHCWSSTPSSLCLEKSSPLGKSGALTLNIAQLNMEKLQAFMPSQLSWHANFNAETNIAWSEDAEPSISANVDSSPGRLIMIDQGDQKDQGSHDSKGVTQYELEYQQLALELLLGGSDAQAKVLFSSEQLGQVNLAAQLDPNDEQRNLQGEFFIEQLHLDVLQPYIPALSRLSGSIAGQGDIDGTLTDPIVTGMITLHDGFVSGDEVPIDISNLGLEIALNGQSADLSGGFVIFDDEGVEGEAVLKGDLNWEQLPPRASLAFSGERLNIKHEYASVRVSPDVQVQYDAQGLSIDGKINIPEGSIVVAELPASAVPTSSDVIIIEEQQQKSSSLPLNLKMGIVLGDEVTIEALGLTGSLSGQLNLDQTPEQPMRGDGEIFIREGQFEAYGQDLIIDEGRISFAGPLDNPYVNLKAYRNTEVTEDDVTAGVQVQGNISNPTLSLYSSPDMDQANQLSFLLRGRAMNSQSDTNMNAMLLGFGVGQLGGSVTRLGEAFGVEDLTVDTQGSGDDTQLELKAQLLPDVELSYGVGVFSTLHELTLRYRLMSDLYLEAVSGLDSSIDLLYEFEF